MFYIGATATANQQGVSSESESLFVANVRHTTCEWETQRGVKYKLVTNSILKIKMKVRFTFGVARG